MLLHLFLERRLETRKPGTFLVELVEIFLRILLVLITLRFQPSGAFSFVPQLLVQMMDFRLMLLFDFFKLPHPQFQIGNVRSRRILGKFGTFGYRRRLEFRPQFGDAVLQFAKGLVGTSIFQRLAQVRDADALKFRQDAQLPFEAINVDRLGFVLGLQNAKLFGQLGKTGRAGGFGASLGGRHGRAFRCWRCHIDVATVWFFLFVKREG
mmetsp:Transcript_128831/g.192069  ORF Transcript_128831/g.192069 Transcript_128831/m.192069 type:complete len:209 (-) Transcript_128831:263-889(-)